jgi:hypothetical protein
MIVPELPLSGLFQAVTVPEREFSSENWAASRA